MANWNDLPPAVKARALARAKLRDDPASLFGMAGMTPDPWQAALLRAPGERTLLMCSRQAGKSETAAALGVVTALLRPGSLVLLLSPSERQSGELAAKVFHFYDSAGQPVLTRKRTELQLHLTNSSRVIALPSSEATIRGYSGVTLLIVDEASRVPDELYRAVRPMLAVSGGRLICLSTPFGKRGFFYEEWRDQMRAWDRIKVTAAECPRISAEFLAAEKVAMGGSWFNQEYGCSFESIEGAEFPAEYFDWPGFWFSDWPQGDALELKVMALDPSKGADAETSDYQAIILYGRDKHGTEYVEADLARRPMVAARAPDGTALTDGMVERTLELYARFRPETLAIEVNQFQALLMVPFRSVAPIYHLCPNYWPLDNRVKKAVRIRRLGEPLSQRRFRFRDNPGTRLLVDQLREWSEEAPYDDGPDALEMARRVAMELWHGRQSRGPSGWRV